MAAILEENLELWLDQQGYSGRAKTYLSAGRNAFETWVIGLQQGLFPMSEWFEVRPVHGVGSEESARAWKALERDFLTKRMQIKRVMPKFLRQFVTYGTGILKHEWHEEYVRMRFWEHVAKDAPNTDREDDAMLETVMFPSAVILSLPVGVIRRST